MNINQLLFSNYSPSCWEPVLASSGRYLKIDREGEEFYTPAQSQVYFRKSIESQTQMMGIVATLRKLGLELFLAQVERATLDLNEQSINEVLLLPEDYLKFIAPRVQNVYTSGATGEISAYDFERAMRWHALLPSAAIREACCNKISITVNRPLTDREIRAFDAPGGEKISDLFFLRLCLKSDNLAFENRAGHVWGVGPIVIFDNYYHENSSYVQFDGERETEIDPEKPEFQRPYIFKQDNSTAMRACKALHIPFIVNMQGGSAYNLYLLPEDYQKLRKMGVHNCFDPAKPVRQSVDQNILPAASDCLIGQELWLHLFWNALEVELNRPLSEVEKVVPLQSSSEELLIALRRELEGYKALDNGVVETFRGKVREWLANNSSDDLGPSQAEVNRKRGEIAAQMAILETKIKSLTS